MFGFSTPTAPRCPPTSNTADGWSAGWPATCRRWAGSPTGWHLPTPLTAGNPLDGNEIGNTHYRLRVDPARGGGVVSLVEAASGRELIAGGKVGNELAVYDEYPAHPEAGEGPWHLLPRGPVVCSSADRAAGAGLPRTAG